MRQMRLPGIMRLLAICNAAAIGTLVVLVQRGVIRSYPDLLLGSLAMLVIDGVLLFRWHGRTMNTPAHSAAEHLHPAITGITKRLWVGIAACALGAIVLRDQRYLILAGIGVLVIAVLFLIRRLAT